MGFFLIPVLDRWLICATIRTWLELWAEKILSKGSVMKNILISLFGLAILTGCASYYDYYKGGVRYTQDGDDCVFYYAERGRHFSDKIRSLDTDKKVVYRNTKCSDLYLRDNAGQPARHDRKIIVPAAKSDCGCKTCSTKKYVIVK